MSLLRFPTVDVERVDGTALAVPTLAVDHKAYERTAVRHNWGRLDENPVTYLTFIAWHAGKRLGLVDGDLDAFVETVAAIGEADEQAPPPDPTQPAASPDSA